MVAEGKPVVSSLAGAGRLRQGLSRRGMERIAAIALSLAAATGWATAQQPTTQQNFEQIRSQAEAAREAGDALGAAALYEQGLKMNPAWPDGWWYLGQLRYGTNNYAQAVDAFSHYLELLPNAAPATAMRGLCEFELGQYEPSLRDVDRALQLGAADGSRNEQILEYHRDSC